MGLDILYPIIGRCRAPVKPVNLDDWYDQYNRTFLFYMSLVFAVIITIRSTCATAIACDGFPPDRLPFAEDWCWARGIYTIKEAYELKKSPSPYPGVIPEDIPACIPLELKSGGKVECPPEHKIKPLTRIYHSWYPFAMFYFWCTSITFFIPYKLFKLWGFDEIKRVVDILQNPVEDGPEQREIMKRGTIWLYLRAKPILTHRSIYAFVSMKHSLGLALLLSKALYVGNCLVIYWFTQRMFKLGSFIEYGILYEADNPFSSVRTLIQDKLFPKTAACELKRYGLTGIEEDQGMCMLVVNVLNQYLFLIFWVCLLIGLILNIMSLLHTAAKLIFPSLMWREFLRKEGMQRSPARKITEEIYLNTGTTMRLILNIFASQIDNKMFSEVLVQLYALIGDNLPTKNKQVTTPNTRATKRTRYLPTKLQSVPSFTAFRRKTDDNQDHIGSRQEVANGDCHKDDQLLQVPLLLLNGEIISLRSESLY